MPPSATIPRTRLELDGVSVDARVVHAAREPVTDDRLWVADVSQVWAANAWLHFGFVIDRHSRRCRGFSFHRVLHPELVADAIADAVVGRRAAAAPNGSGSGPLEPAVVFSRRCYSAGVDFPAGAVASAGDAAAAESFVCSLRRALIDGAEDDTWTSQREATAAIAEWIESVYNPRAPTNGHKRRFAPARNGDRVPASR